MKVLCVEVGVLAGLFIAEYTLDLDDLLKIVSIEPACFAGLADEGIIIVFQNLMKLDFVIWGLAVNERAEMTLIISLLGYEQYCLPNSIFMQLRVDFVRFISLALIPESTAMPKLNPPINSPSPPHLCPPNSWLTGLGFLAGVYLAESILDRSSHYRRKITDHVLALESI